ncbi:Tigger transposable element-derived protein 6 [Phytophthora citrophthora]|uniref:Tigger transposable element-derived protein 6 n=1 Tax=Phytophthora citrophthora TaxID=4793 RepID=A0AAD9GB03_9STRA|nr:Tigger transposable element-derived protein 6 [Phytophthora citrophthora]
MSSSPNYMPDVGLLSTGGANSAMAAATSAAMAQQVQAQQAQVQAQLQAQVQTQQAAQQAATQAMNLASASTPSSGAASPGPDAVVPPVVAKPKQRRRRPEGSGNLTVEQKRRICEKHRSTPKITQKDLCRWAKLEFNLQRAPTQPTMSNILKHEHLFKDNVLGVLGSQRKTIRPTRHAHFDQVLANWVMERQNKGNITGDMIKTKGRELVKQMGLEGKLGFSNGWLASFKARHGLMKRTNTLQNDKVGVSSSSSGTGKDGAAYGGILDANNGMLPNGLSVDPNYMLPPVSMDLSLEQIQEMLRDYVPSDIYTVDETGLFYRASPNKLVQGDEAQSMLADEARLTVLLAVNADASDLMEPYIIGNVVPPKNIKMASISQLGYHYVCSSKARMTVFIFQQWLRDFNARMASAHRNVVLLMDNAPSHVMGCVALSNVRVVMFAPHLGMKVQPMRGGILASFKGKYRLKHLTLAIDHLEDGLSDIYHVKQIQAMNWIVDAWQQTSKELIVNAWKPLGITAPFAFDSAMDGADDKNVEEELWGLLYCLQLSGVVNTKVLVNSRWENDIHKRLNEDMIEDPQENDTEFRVPDAAPTDQTGVGHGHHLAADDEHHAGVQTVSAKDQLKAFRDVIRYLERTGTADSRDPQLMSVIDFLKKKQLSLRFDNASNSTLTI